jgi:hypothetical protein
MSRPKRPEDPRELMAQALRLISRDLDYIEELGKSAKLGPNEAACLVRYSDSLLKYLRDEEEQEADEKRRLSKMSTAELAAKAEELARAAKEKQQKT